MLNRLLKICGKKKRKEPCLRIQWCSVAKSGLTLENPWTVACQALSLVHGISHVRMLEWLAISLSTGSSQTRDGTWVSCTDRQMFYQLGQQELEETLKQIENIKKKKKLEKVIKQKQELTSEITEFTEGLNSTSELPEEKDRKL